MSEDADDSQKTEDPSQRKLEKAKQDGQIASSKELSSLFLLLGLGAAVIFLFPMMGQQITGILKNFLSSAHDMPADGASVAFVAKRMVYQVALAMGFFFLLMLVLALGSNLVQNGLIFSPKPLQPKLEKISPLKGFKRMFSAKSLMEFLKGIMKLGIVCVLTLATIYPLLGNIDQYIQLMPLQVAEALQGGVIRLVGYAAVLMIIVGGIDFTYEKMAFKKKMRMTKQEVKDEFKQSEGDPHVKGKLRQLRQERSQRRMSAAVQDATVILTNPTHYSVALKYDIDGVSAPVVVAKGMDSMAMQIRKIANENDVPIYENPPLARALYAEVEEDEEIPFEHFQAVAEVIKYVMNLDK